jgi:hypothetical protein
LLEYLQQHPLFSVHEVLRDAGQSDSASTKKEVRKTPSVLSYIAIGAGGVVAGYLIKTAVSSSANLAVMGSPPRFF